MRRKRVWLVLLVLLAGVTAWLFYGGPVPDASDPAVSEQAHAAFEAAEDGSPAISDRTVDAASASPGNGAVSAGVSASGEQPPMATQGGGTTNGADQGRDPFATASSVAAGSRDNGSSAESGALRSAADILAEADLRNPAVRAQVVAQLQAQSEQRRAAAEARAAELGIPVRMETEQGQVIELQGFEGDQPLYYTTLNRDAAISAAVPPVYAPPYSLEGDQMPVGVWDAGSVRSTHQELTGRVNLMNSGAALDDHATHVAGTIAASGVQAAAKGMAPGALIYSLDWNNDLAEMANGGAATADDTDRLPLSNHSYGLITGYMPVSATRWRWFGQGEGVNDVDQNFGRYDESARDWDALAYSLPYYSIFQAAGNDRTDNPSPGDRVDNPLGLFRYNFDPALHPGGDGVYRGGFESISYAALAKNSITIGAVEDAVSGGARSLAETGMSSFSSWGPTDDGRIKPDLVANGVGLYSTLSTGDAAYGTYSGTSMATPSAVGAATLLIELYRREFADRLPPASLLRGLLVHTADDLGRTGPDYTYGWGLINIERAADLIMDHVQNAGSPRLITGELTSSATSFSHTFTWNGTDPIRATLSWTDPAGEAQTSHDSRTPVLVHDLNVAVVGPEGTRYLPYVMPFVGTWTVPSLSLPAVTGTNRVDILEQVYVANPGVSGTYTVEVSLSGSLTRSTQPFSLVITGAADATGDTRVLDLQGDLLFGSLAVGATATRPLTIRNIGNAPLEVTGLQVPAGFSASWSGILAPGASQEVGVQFQPLEGIAYEGVVQVLSDATAGADTLPVSGRGVTNVQSLTNSVPVTGLSGAQGNERYFVLNVPAGQERLDFEIAGGNGGDADLYVRFGQLPTTSQWDYRPYLVGSDEIVEVDNPAAGDWYVMVRAYTAYANLTLTGTYVPPATATRILRISGDLDYGNIPVGDQVVRTITLSNDGSETLTVSAIQLPEGFAGAWSGGIPSGGSQDVDITFAPLLEQSYTGIMTVSSDKTLGDGSLPVSGNGVLNAIPLQNGVEVGPFNGVLGSMSFFYIDVPPGQHLLEVSMESGDGGTPDLYVRRGATPSLDVFDFRAWEDDLRVLQINTPASDRWYIMLHGVVQYTGARLVVRYETEDGAERVIRLEPSLDFGIVRINETALQTFNIHNDGNAPLNVSGITYPNGFSGAADVSIPSGGVHQVQVTFAPMAAGVYSGDLTVKSDATSGDASLAITGEGVDSDAPIPLQNGVAVSSLTGAIGSESYYVVDIPPDTDELTISLSGGSGDADLYVRYGSLPTLSEWDYRPFRLGNNESVEVVAPTAGPWYIMLHGWRAYGGATLVADYVVRNFGVYRFWSPVYNGHFYTISPSERDHILATWPDVWDYEGIAWHAHTAPSDGTSPIYRFWSPVHRKHFYTISSAERDYVMAVWPDIWSYEGIAWHAYTTAGSGRSPVYRFWSPVYNGHFYTISQAERDYVIATWPDIWHYEGIAYYAFRDGQQVTATGLAAFHQDPAKPVDAVFAGALADDSSARGTRLELDWHTLAGRASATATQMVPADANAEGVYYPLAYDDRYVAAMVYDLPADAWRHVLGATWAPEGLRLPALPLGQRAWLAVLTLDAEADAWTLAHGNWFGRLDAEPAALSAILADAVLTGVELPVETLRVPEAEGPVSLRVYDQEDGQYIATVAGLTGGDMYKFAVPAWNRWNRIDFIEEATGRILASQWIGHHRTHGTGNILAP